MSQNIINDSYFLLYSFLMGIVLSAAYDLFRIIRKILPHSIFMISFEDILFWIFCGLTIFGMLHALNNGTYRWFSILGTGVGMFLYKRWISNPIVNGISFVIRKLLSFLTRPITFLVKKIGILLGAAKKKGHLGGQYTKKKLTGFLKMLRMVVKKQ